MAELDLKFQELAILKEQLETSSFWLSRFQVQHFQVSLE